MGYRDTVNYRLVLEQLTSTAQKPNLQWGNISFALKPCRGHIHFTKHQVRLYAPAGSEAITIDPRSSKEVQRAASYMIETLEYLAKVRKQ